jgi:hypothetical protein
MRLELIKLDEPELMFGYGQKLEDPRDGLTLFGPLEAGKPYGIRWAVLGTKEGIRKFRKWVEKIQGPISNVPADIARPPFPGFQTVFRIPWGLEPVVEKEIPQEEIKKNCFLDDKYQRVYKTVELFSQRIKKALKEEDVNADIWFIIIPDYIYKYCRPESTVEPELRIEPEYRMSVKYARSLKETRSLFEEDNIAAIPYDYEIHFHNQIKARLLGDRVTTQIIRESTIAHDEFLDKFGRPLRNLEDLQSAIAWNISTTVFYKAGGRPWKIGSIREGVCYLGLVFKRDERQKDERSACCAAQMFLDSGDGVVFKGAVGPWYNPSRGTFHLKKKDARELVQLALRSYEDMRGKPPIELFIHGKVAFSYEEQEGFQEALGRSTKLVGVRIKDGTKIRLYRKGRYPILRGLAYLQDERSAFLWTKGYVPRLQTSIALEVPRPLEIMICFGKANLETVLNDIMSLTKLNYNACIFGDGQPVTLKFADAVGEILTAGPIGNVPPLPFKFYI